MSAESSTTFPPVTPGGSLILAWQLRNKRVLLVGGGLVASGRLSLLLDADALVTLISPRGRLHPLIVHRIFNDPQTKDRITYLDRHFTGESDLDDVDMVLTAIDDVETSKSICQMARARRIPVNVADVPPECDFYFGSMVRRGPLQVMVSTGGKGPKIANLIKRRIEAALPDDVGDAIERVGALRAELRRRAPGVGGKLGQKRMDWMIGVCDTWSLEQLGQVDDVAVQILLDEGWERNGRVPTFDEVQRALGRRTAPKLLSWLPLPSRDFTLGLASGAAVAYALSVLWRKI